MNTTSSIRIWAGRIKRDAVTLWFVARDPETPMIVKLLSLLVVSYALSPIDLIPDFIPVLGYLDDFLILPALIWLVVKLLPAGVLAANRIKAEQWMASQGRKPRSQAGLVLVVLVWLAVAVGAWRWWSGS